MYARTPLALRLTLRDERRQEDAGRQEARGRPEERELQVPGARQVERQQRGQVEPEEALQVGSIMLGRRPEERLDEQQGDDEDEPRDRPLAGRQAHSSPGCRNEIAWALLLECQPILSTQAAVDGEHDAGPADEHDEGEHRPDDEIGRRSVVDERLGWPVVRVGVGSWPGRQAADAHAVHAKKDVTCLTSVGSVIALAMRPFFFESGPRNCV